MTVQVRLPDSTLKLVKSHISQREKGLFAKGMIMEFVNRAVKRLLAVEKGELIEQVPQQHTHTKRDNAKKELLLLNGES